ncbi:MAG: polysaccharide pyruvyl transferase family protein [Bacteroidaceae bacterium]|nr:polysaccharide pyruvyl transferase family protein [Bacteroidaceae bacterium]
MKAGTTKYVILSDFNVRSNNRGTAALGYGALAFLQSKGYIDDGFEIVKIRFHRYPWSKIPKEKVSELDINGKKWKLHELSVWALERYLYRFRLHFLNTLYRRTISNVRIVAAINGGDGLTDLYGNKLLDSRLPEMKLAIESRIPFIVMPQTIGPFLDPANKERILSILGKAQKIYVRDTNFVKELEDKGLQYEVDNDLSYYMQPEPVDVEIKHPCVGVNVSGLAYSNRFGNLAGEFDCYPALMEGIVRMFQSKGCNVYIIPHSYNTQSKEVNNDDMEASKLFYDGLAQKENVFFIDRNLVSPQIKYLISQMDFFIGTRMHANFAAIFTGTPVFGLAYSYKFKGAFERNGIYNRVALINNLKESDISGVLSQIESAYNDDVKSKQTK